MIRFNGFNQRAALCALLLCFSLGAAADDFQEANKLFKHGQAAQALVKIDTLLVSHPKDAQSRFLKGVILSDQGKTAEAAHIFTALTVDYPELPEPYNNLAVIYAGQGEYEKAKTALEAALQTHPSYATAHENLGDIYAQMASQAYGRALQLNPNKTETKPKLTLLNEIHYVANRQSTAKTQIASLPAATAAPKSNTESPVSQAVKTTAEASITGTVAPTPAITSTPIVVKETVKESPKAAKPSVTAPNSQEEILKTVHSWAQAWSSRNANKYLSMYAKDFSTPHNVARKVWEQERRERIDKPQPIVVSIINPKLKMLDGTHASVSFVQSYHSGKLKSVTRKTLKLTRENDIWKIQSEQTGV
jgi:tetratricopeptide (TPR) repeat protein